jgi:hypothetical protein
MVARVPDRDENVTSSRVRDSDASMYPMPTLPS